MVYIFILFLLFRIESRNLGRGSRLLYEELNNSEYGLGDEYFEDNRDRGDFESRREKYRSQDEKDDWDDYQDPGALDEDFLAADDAAPIAPDTDTPAADAPAVEAAPVLGADEGAKEADAEVDKLEKTEEKSDAEAEAQEAADAAKTADAANAFEAAATEAKKEAVKAEVEKNEAKTKAKEEDKEAKALEAEAEKEAEKLESDATNDAVPVVEPAPVLGPGAKTEPGGETLKAGVETEKAKQDAERAKAEAEKAKADAEKVKSEVAAQKASLDAAKVAQEKAEIEKAKTEAEKAKADAERAKAEAEKAQNDATEAKKDEGDPATAQVKVEAEKAKAEAEKAKAEAEKAKADAATAKAETAAKQAEADSKAKAEIEKMKAETEMVKAEAAAQVEAITPTGGPNAAASTAAPVIPAPVISGSAAPVLDTDLTFSSSAPADSSAAPLDASGAPIISPDSSAAPPDSSAAPGPAASTANPSVVLAEADKVKEEVKEEVQKEVTDAKKEMEEVKEKAAKEVEEAKKAQQKANDEVQKARDAEDKAQKEIEDAKAEGEKEKERAQVEEQRAREKEKKAEDLAQAQKQATLDAENAAKQAEADAAKEVQKETDEIKKAAESDEIKKEIAAEVRQETLKETEKIRENAAKIIPVIDDNGNVEAADEAERAKSYRDEAKALLAGATAAKTLPVIDRDGNIEAADEADLVSGAKGYRDETKGLIAGAAAAKRLEKDSKYHAKRAEKYADESRKLLREARIIADNGGSRREEDRDREDAARKKKQALKEATKADRERAEAKKDMERAHKGAVYDAKNAQSKFEPEDISTPREFFLNRISGCPKGSHIRNIETCRRAKESIPQIAGLRGPIEINEEDVPPGCYKSADGIEKIMFNPGESKIRFQGKNEETGSLRRSVCRYVQISRPHNHCPRDNEGCPQFYFKCLRGPAEGGCFPHDMEDENVCRAFSVKPCTVHEPQYSLPHPKPKTCIEELSGTRGEGYKGCQDKTRSGYTCQSWASQAPHMHSRGAMIGDMNYCRNPEAEEKTIWCYTTNPNVRFDYCDPVGQEGPKTKPPMATEKPEELEPSKEPEPKGPESKEPASKVPAPTTKPEETAEVIKEEIDKVIVNDVKDLKKAAKDGPENMKKVEKKLIGKVTKIVEKEKEKQEEKQEESKKKIEKDMKKEYKKELDELTKPELGPPETKDAAQCDESLRGYRDEAYRGCQTVTVSGKKCQNWMTQTPHAHKYTKGKDGTGNHNYCRNPDGDETIWCYTTDPMKRMDYCKPKEDRCDENLHEGRGEGYRGCQSKTISGKTCQKWTEQAPHKHDEYTGEEANGDGISSHNYCRNPGGMKSSIWCYTTDIMKRWEYCAPKTKASLYDKGQESYYIKVADKPLFIHAWGGSKAKAWETLHFCPKKADHPNCQWTIMPSTTRPNAFYIKVSNKNLFVHALGGAVYGARTQLRECNFEKDMDRCQWEITNSPTRPGMVYIKSAGAELFLMAKKRSKVGAEVILHPCPRSDDIPNCQWMIEGYPLPGQIPGDEMNGKLFDEMNRQKSKTQKALLGKMRAEMRATDAQRTAILAQNLADEGVMQIHRANLKLEELQRRLEDAQRRYAEMEEKGKLDRKKNRAKNAEKRDEMRQKEKKLEKERTKRKELLKNEKAQLKEVERERKEEIKEEKKEQAYQVEKVKEEAKKESEDAEKEAKEMVQEIKKQEKKKTEEVKELEHEKEEVAKQKVKTEYLRKRAKDKEKLVKKEKNLKEKKKELYKKACAEKEKMKAKAKAKGVELSKKIKKIKGALNKAAKKKADAIIHKEKAKEAETNLKINSEKKKEKKYMAKVEVLKQKLHKKEAEEKKKEVEEKKKEEAEEKAEKKKEEAEKKKEIAEKKKEVEAEKQEAKDMKKEAEAMKKELEEQKKEAEKAKEDSAPSPPSDHVFSGVCPGSDREEYAGASNLDECAKAASLAEFEYASYSDKQDRCFMYKNCDTGNLKHAVHFRTMALLWTEAPTGKKLRKSDDNEKFDEKEDELFSKWLDGSSSDQSSSDEDYDLDELY